MPGLHITTLGCKLNQLDSAELAGALRDDLDLVGDPRAAALIVVNTCTVTGAADADARQILRRRRRENPRAVIVATGCYAERDPEALRSMPEVDLVIGRAERPAARGLVLDRIARRFPGVVADGCAERAVGEALPDFGDRSRAYLRVQEGCDLRCSYCIIPKVRGASRSVPPEVVEGKLRDLIAAGFHEVVLTGVNTGDYGRDLGGGWDLARLLDRILALDGDYRVRLNSVEPRCVTPALVDLIAGHPRLARHLQIPLQSGSDRVLRDMRRNYRTADYRGLVEDLRARVPDIGIGADVIVGFPTERDEDFDRTMAFVASTPLNYLHVFSYSHRPGTDAAASGIAADPAATADRSRRLRALGRRKAAAFRAGFVGRVMRLLVMRGLRRDGRRRALSSNFIEVALDSDAPENRFVEARIVAVDRAGGAVGRIDRAA